MYVSNIETNFFSPQFLRQETGSLWSEYASQCFQLGENTDQEQEKAGLHEQWRSQQSSLQRRGSSLAAALRQIDSTENHMVDFSDRLDRYLRQPKDISGFTLANSNILKDIKVSHRPYMRAIRLEWIVDLRFKRKDCIRIHSLHVLFLNLY